MLPALLLILLIPGGFSLFYGHHVSNQRSHANDTMQRTWQYSFDTMRLNLQHADTSSAVWKQLSHPSVVQFRLKKNISPAASAFSGLSVGSSDMAASHYPVEIAWDYLYAEEKFSNPLKLLTGNFDLSFLLIYVFPLLIIGLNFNLLSGEKEQGTLPLIQVQKGSILQLLLTRLLFRWMLLLTAFALLTAAGLAMNAMPVKGRDVLSWMVTGATYLLVWSMLTFFIISWQRSSAFNAFSLLGCWIFLLIALPAAFQLFSRAHAADAPSVASEQREVSNEVWDYPQKQVLDSFYAYYPQYRNERAYDTGYGGTRRGMAYYEVLQQKMNRFIQPETEQRQQELQDIQRSYLYNPAVYTQSLLNKIAGTDASDQAWFRQEVRRFQDEWKHFFYHFVFTDRFFSPEDYDRLPAYVPREDLSKQQNIINGNLYLLALALCFALGGWYRFKN